MTTTLYSAPVEEYTAVRYFLEDRLMGLDGKLLGTEAHQWSWLKKDMVDGFFEVAKNSFLAVDQSEQKLL